MGSVHGQSLAQFLHQRGKRDVQFECIESAGHQLFFENPWGFMEAWQCCSRGFDDADCRGSGERDEHSDVVLDIAT